MADFLYSARRECYLRSMDFRHVSPSVPAKPQRAFLATYARSGKLSLSPHPDILAEIERLRGEG